MIGGDSWHRGGVLELLRSELALPGQDLEILGCFVDFSSSLLLGSSLGASGRSFGFMKVW